MLRALMDKPKQIRNMSVIAHVDHGASHGRRRAVLRIRSRMRLLRAPCALLSGAGARLDTDPDGGRIFPRCVPPAQCTGSAWVVNVAVYHFRRQVHPHGLAGRGGWYHCYGLGR